MSLYLRRLRLANFRGAVDLAMELHPRMNVVIGENGGGKSTVLDAAVIALSWVAGRIRNARGGGRPIGGGDIRRGAAGARVEAALAWEGGEGDVVWGVGRAAAKRRGGGDGRGNGGGEYASSLVGAGAFAERVWEAAGAGAEDDVNLPLFAYYPVDRAVREIPQRLPARPDYANVDAYEGALTAGANFKSFFQWFREMQSDEHGAIVAALRKGGQGGEDFQSRELRAVRAALKVFMGGFANLRVERRPVRLEVDKAGETLLVSQLSDGEKCLLAMVGDLARRLVIANPRLANPLEGEGVVLIDEVDLHLHPRWQREMVPNLLKVFPNCQFILSTHSPHVVNHVEEGAVFVLKLGAEGLAALRAAEVYGRMADEVEERLMGTDGRPDAVADKMDEIYRLINGGKIAAAQEKIADLRGRIGTDPDLVKADVLIVRRQAIGR